MPHGAMQGRPQNAGSYVPSGMHVLDQSRGRSPTRLANMGSAMPLGPKVPGSVPMTPSGNRARSPNRGIPVPVQATQGGYMPYSPMDSSQGYAQPEYQGGYQTGYQHMENSGRHYAFTQPAPAVDHQGTYMQGGLDHSVGQQQTQKPGLNPEHQAQYEQMLRVGRSIAARDEEAPGDSEFMRLLDSLEVRVDLMAQMQHTRNQIQARARQLEGEGEDHDDGAGYANDGTNSTGYGHRQMSHMDSGGDQGNGDLARENQNLWAQLGEQREVISKLTSEVEDLRGQLKGLGLPAGMSADTLRTQLQAVLSKARDTENEVQELREQLSEEQNRTEHLVKEWAVERELLQAELSSARRARSPAGSRAGSRRPSETGTFTPGGRFSGVNSGRVSDYGGGSTPQGRSGVAGMPTVAVLSQDLPSEAALSAPWGVSAPVQELPPFSRQTCGVNIALSEDGYTATRTRGCRQSVLIGSAPVPRQRHGWYFEVEIRETVDGWVGGLGIGVTKTAPGQLRRVPDKAWRMPGTFIVGYWGCVFLDGKERRTKWRVDNLPSGTKIGLLVCGDGSGDLRVFAKGEPVVRVEGAVTGLIDSDMELYPVVDVFAATLSVALCPRASPPPPPWADGATTLSPPGSPSGSMVSVPMSQSSSMMN